MLDYMKFIIKKPFANNAKSFYSTINSYPVVLQFH